MSKAKAKALISCTVTAQLIWTFAFANAKSKFSNDTAHIEMDQERDTDNVLNDDSGADRQFTGSLKIKLKE